MPIMTVPSKSQTRQIEDAADQLNTLEAMLISRIEERAKADPLATERFRIAVQSMPSGATRAEAYAWLRREFSDIAPDLPERATAAEGFVRGFKDSLWEMGIGTVGYGALGWAAGKLSANPGMAGKVLRTLAGSIIGKGLARLAPPAFGLWLLGDVVSKLSSLPAFYSTQDWYMVGKLAGEALGEALGLYGGTRVHRRITRKTAKPPEAPETAKAPTEGEAAPKPAEAAPAQSPAAQEAAPQARAQAQAQPKPAAEQAPAPAPPATETRTTAPPPSQAQPAPAAQAPAPQEITQRLEQVKENIRNSNLPEEAKQLLVQFTERLAESNQGKVPRPIEPPLPKTKEPPGQRVAAARKTEAKPRTKPAQKKPTRQQQKPAEQKPTETPKQEAAAEQPAEQPPPEPARQDQPVEQAAPATTPAEEHEIASEIEELLRQAGGEAVGKLPGEPTPKKRR